MMRDQMLFLWAQTMGALNIERYFVAMYGADVVPVQQERN